MKVFGYINSGTIIDLVQTFTYDFQVRDLVALVSANQNPF
jgi:hypothetical protein